MGSSEDPSLVNNVDELDLVYQGLTRCRDMLERRALSKCDDDP